MKILIVDDHRLFLDGIRTILLDLFPFYEVVAFNNCRQAIDSIDKADKYDLALVDLHLPGIDGLSFLQSLSQRNLLFPTIVISATTNEKEIQHALNLGANGFIPKYYSADELDNAINTVLENEVYLPREFHHLRPKIAIKAENSASGLKQGVVLELSGRRLEILKLIASGHSNKTIAQILNIGEPTVKTHIASLFKLFDVNNRTACVVKGQELGLIE